MTTKVSNNIPPELLTSGVAHEWKYNIEVKVFYLMILVTEKLF